MSQQTVDHEIATAPLERVIWFANNANSSAYRTAAQAALRFKPTEAKKCYRCDKWRAITNFDLEKDGQRKAHCFNCK